jgi:hypothetical protein
MKRSGLLFRLPLWLGLIWLALWIRVPQVERAGLFAPGKEIESTPAAFGYGFEEVLFSAEDGVRLTGWWIPAADARGTALFFHGNSGNISNRLWLVRNFQKLGLNLFLFDYRGYGRSEGVPSEPGLYRDARAAREYLIGARGIKPESLLYYGESLGGAVAADLAVTKPPAALALEGAFTSVADMASRHYPWIPARPFLKTRFDTLTKIGKVGCPSLFLHAAGDEIVPLYLGERLFQASPARHKKLLPLPGGHNAFFETNAAAVLSALEELLREAGI